MIDNNDLISREALKKEIRNNKKVAGRFIEGVIMLIDNAPIVKPCENCDLYFKAMTKEEQKGGAE